jgi:Na+/H+ antiporter
MVMVARKIKIAYPVLLVPSGLVLSFFASFNNIELEPELIFVIFLPPLLYEAAWNISWKDLWKWRRVIGSFAFFIVLLTSSIVAVVSSILIPGFSLALGFLLGGIISPPDAVSASAIIKNVSVPKRLSILLEGESLLNDASSLVVFRFALAAVMTGGFVFTQAAGEFFIVITMGIFTGLVIAVVFYLIHKYLPTTTNIDIILTFLAPYMMYVVAEEFHVSGVLSVVSGGLFLSARRDRFLSHKSRLQGINVWEAVAFVLNGFVFLLIGLELPVVIRGLGDRGLVSAIGYSAVISLLLIITRLGCAFGAVYFTRFISRYITTADANPSWKVSLLFGWAGMRGVVSLAAALSIPLTLDSGNSFPQRNLILFITFSVIVVTLLLQGITFPALIRWVDIKDTDYKLSPERQLKIIKHKLSQLSLDILDTNYSNLVSSNGLVQAIRVRMYSEFNLISEMDDEANFSLDETLYSDYVAVHQELIAAQRKLLKELRSKDQFEDDLIRTQFVLLDLEEERLQRQFNQGIE